MCFIAQNSVGKMTYVFVCLFIYLNVYLLMKILGTSLLTKPKLQQV